MKERLEMIRDKVEQYDGLDPTAFWNRLSNHFSEYTFAQCALDVAAWDWMAKSKNQALYQHWGLNINQLPPTSYTLSIAKVEKMVERMEETPWPVYKIKLGRADDMDRVRALRQHTKAKFWVDINAAWTAAETIEKSFELKELGVDFIEQPLPYDEWDAMEKVFQESALPLIADESCRTLEDITRCQNCFHGVNIKIMKAGGLTPALKMIQAAKKQGLKVMVGCMTESTVGISGIAHLLPLLDYADMDGALFLKQDIASGVEIKKDTVVFPKTPGTGAMLLS